MKIVSKKKPYTTRVHENLEQIHSEKLFDMGLFELSIHSLMPCDVYHELRKRIELIKTSLENGKPDIALNIANRFLNSPQENIKARLPNQFLRNFKAATKNT